MTFFDTEKLLSIQHSQEYNIDEELLKKGFLPRNEEFDEVSNVSQEIVENNPRRFIIEECIPACQELWSKNIYTFMVSDHLNEGQCWIEVFMDSLSDENKDIYINFTGEDILKFSYHYGTINFGVKYVGTLGQQKLLELAKQFKMQDVPSKLAYLSKENFLINYCKCYDEVPNPNYFEMKDPLFESDLSIEKKFDYLKKYIKWENSVASHKTILKLNLSKMTKPLEELVKDNGMILDGDRIYLSPFHYKKHQRYLRTLKNEMIDELPNMKIKH